MATYKINKGNHYSSLFTWDRLLPFTGLKAEGTFVLDSSCWHERNDIEYTGWNKLCGISQLFGIHQNSGRLVWQPYFERKNRFRLAGYVYDDGGKWEAQEFMEIEANVEYHWSVEWRDGFYYFKVSGFNKVMFGGKPKCGVKCYPYFGGRSVAPHNMKIELNYR